MSAYFPKPNSLRANVLSNYTTKTEVEINCR